MQRLHTFRACSKINAKSHNFQLWCSYSSTTKPKSDLADSNDKVQYQNYMFDQEKKRNVAKKVPRIEKIQVDYQGHGISNSAVMFMNKNLSTSWNCAMHVSKNLADKMVISKVTPKSRDSTGMMVLPNPQDNVKLLGDDGQFDTSYYWDAHRELPFDCQVEFLNFQSTGSNPQNIKEVNKAYWRSCAMVLGATLSKAFKGDYSLGFLEMPAISVESGAFCYDISIDEQLADWKPSHDNLVFLTKLARSIISSNKKFERLEVDASYARQLFQDDKFRLERLKSYNAKQAIPLYRIGDFIEITDGPLISNPASHIFHYVVTACHSINKDSLIRRIQGISLPESLKVHHTVWTMLENRARRLVKENLPESSDVSAEDVVSPFAHKSIENETKVYTKSTGQWNPDKFLKEEGTLNI